jgi:hypothetical protein
MMKFRDRTTGTSFLPLYLSFVSNFLMAGIISATSTAMGQTARHFDFSSFPVDFQIVFTQPRVSQDKLLFSEVRDGKQSLFRVGFVSKYKIHDFSYGSVPSILKMGMGLESSRRWN